MDLFEKVAAFNLFSLTCYEGDGADSGDGEGEGAGAGAGAGAGDGNKNFTQEDLNKFLADDRRKHQARYEKLEQQMMKLAESKTLEEEQRQQYATELEDLRAQWLTKEQRAAYERKQEQERYKIELQTTKETAEKYQVLYTNHVITDSIRHAADPQIVTNPELFVQLLKPKTQIRELTDNEGKPTGQKGPLVELDDVNEETGEKMTTLRTPTDAVKRMQELPQLYGGLFRANVVSGVGAGTATDGRSSGGEIDVREVAKDPALYRKLRKENPQALGLRPKNY